MTRVQVMDLFEENPDKEKVASSRLLNQDEIDIYVGLDLLPKGTKAGTIAQATIDKLVQARGQDVTSTGQNLRNQQALARLGFDVEKLRADSLQWMLDMQKKNPSMYNKIMTGENFRGLRDFLQGKTDSFSLDTQSKKWLGIELDKVPGLGAVMNVREEVVTPGQPSPNPTPSPAKGEPGTSGKRTFTPEEDERIRGIARSLRQTDKITSKEDLMKKATQMYMSGQTSPMGVTETPGMEQQIGTALQQPIQQAPVAAPQAAPTTSSLMQKSVLPQQGAGVSDPNQYVLELARQYRDKLANSPYQVA